MRTLKFTLIHASLLWILFGGVLGTNAFAQITSPKIVSPRPSSNASPYIVCSHIVTLIGNKPNVLLKEKGYWENTTTIEGAARFLGDSTKDTVIVELFQPIKYRFEWHIVDTAGQEENPASVYIQNATPTFPKAGNDQTTCGSTFQLQANVVGAGTGIWLDNNSSLTYSPNRNTANATVSNLAKGNNVLIWETSNPSSCPNIVFRDTVVITNLSPSEANAVGPLYICTDTAYLASSVPTFGKGRWVVPAGVSIDSSDLYHPKVWNLPLDAEQLIRWEVVTDPSKCPNASTSLPIKRYKPETATIFGKVSLDTIICQNTFQLQANVPIGSGTWIYSTGGLVFNDPTKPNAIVSNLPSGSTNLKWRIANGSCSPSEATITIHNEAVLKPIVKADSCFIAKPADSILTLVTKYKLKAGENGVWKSINYAPSSIKLINDPPSQRASFHPLGADQYQFWYVSSNATCKDSAASKYTVLTRAVLPEDKCFFSNPNSKITLGIKPLTVPRLAKGEKATWNVSPFDTSITITPRGDSLLLTAKAGVYTIEYSITNENCPSCAVACPNKDVLVVTISERARITSTTELCTVSPSRTITGITSAKSDSVRWSSLDNTLTFGNKAGATTTVSNLKIGRNTLMYTLYYNGCRSVDSLKITRLTKPDVGLDRCYGFEGNSNVTIDTIVGKSSPAPSEGVDWTPSPNLSVLSIPSSPNKLVLKSSQRGSYLLRYTISTVDCQGPNSFSDTMRISFLTKPAVLKDTFFTKPFVGQPRLESKDVLLSGEYGVWYSSNGDSLSSGSQYLLPGTITVGKKLFNFSIKNTYGCSLTSSQNVWIITKPKIISSPCLRKSVNNTELRADSSFHKTLETGQWSYDTNKYKDITTSNVSFQPQILKVFNMDTSKYVFYWSITTSDKKYTVRDSIVLTNLTNPDNVKVSNPCIVGTSASLIPQELKLQAYERARWIITQQSANSRLKHGTTPNDSLLGLLPGQLRVALIVKDTASVCADTSLSKLLTVISKPVTMPQNQICITDTVVTLQANNFVSDHERGVWSYVRSASGKVPTITDSLASVTQARGLGKRNTRFLWTIKSKYNSPSFACNSSDSLRVVVNTRAKVAFKDTCLVGRDSLTLKAIPVENYEKASWIFLSDTLSRSNTFNNKQIRLGNSSFIYEVNDLLYTACKTRDTTSVHSIPRAKIDSFTTCIVRNRADPYQSTDVRVRRELNSGALHSWVKITDTSKDTIFKKDSTNNSVRYSFLVSEIGRRDFAWRIQSAISPKCVSMDTLRLAIVPQANAGADVCATMGSIILQADSSQIRNNVKGTWRSPAGVIVVDTAKSKTQVVGLSKGVTEFLWTVKLGSCQHVDSLKVNYITQSIAGKDSCVFFDRGLSVSLQKQALAPTEMGLWISPEHLQMTDAPSSTQVTGFKLGENVLIWRIISRLDPGCQNDSTIRINTFTPSGFKNRDTLFTCGKDTLVSSNAPVPLEEVIWRTLPSNRIATGSDSTLRVSQLSNDTVYTVYRSINLKDTKASCGPLTDSVKIINRQLDSLTLKPEGLTHNLNQGQYFTCQPAFLIEVNKASADIATATGGWLPYKQPEENNGSLIMQLNSDAPLTQKYRVSQMLAAGNYEFTWQARNRNFCPALVAKIFIERRTGLSGLPFAINDSVCGQKTYSFNKDQILTYDKADSVKWQVIYPISGPQIPDSLKNINDKKRVFVTDLESGRNTFTYTAQKDGCIGTTTINLINNRNLYDVFATDSAISQCGKDTAIVVASHTLTAPDPFYFKFYWSRDKRRLVPTDLVSVTGDRSNEIKAIVQNIPLNGRVTVYAVSKNGVCPFKIDSVTISNYAPIKGAAYIKNKEQDTICGTRIFLASTKPSYASGAWFVNDSIPTFSSTSDTATWLSGLASSMDKYKYTVVWKSQNGACENSDTLMLTVGDSLIPPQVSSANIEVCDSSMVTLSALPMPPSTHGIWLADDTLSHSLVTRVKVEKDVPKFFVWRTSNGFCSADTTVRVMSYHLPTPANAGTDISVILNQATLSGNVPRFGKGRWTVVSGSAIIQNDSSSVTSVSNLSAENEFLWSISNGVCPVSSDKVIVIFSDFAIPSGFSPNGDDKNEKFEIKGLENYSGSKLKIYNRWGTQVFASDDYRNDWDANGLEDDTYYYELVVPSAGKKHGYIVVKRK